MIIDTLIGFLLNILNGILSLIPNIPPMPDAIQQPTTYFLTLAVQTFNLLNYFFGLPVMLAIIFVSFSILFFEQAYHTIMWIVRKIPVINIK